MPSNGQHTVNEEKTARRRVNLELYYYERVGNRLYFRITPFAIILMLVAAIVGVTIIIIDYMKHPPRETDITITMPSASPDPANNTIIRPASPPSLHPKVNKQPAFISPSPAAVSSKNDNMNKQSQTRPTLSPEPSP